jgi:hypothetical protein
MQGIIETPTFLRDVAESGMSQEEHDEIVAAIARNPMIGDPIPNTGGARKARFRGRGKGKSGGYRVVTFYSGVDIPVFLLALINKGERADLSRQERNELRKELAAVPHDYRAGVARVARSRRRRSRP